MARWFCVAMLLVMAAPAHAQDGLSPRLQAFREIYKELVEINTTDGSGDTTQAAEAMAVRLRAAGVPAHDIQVIGSAPRKGNLVARLRGTGARRPILLLAHLDVVEARRQDWAFDPFTLQEVDGMFRGRGTVDNKAMAASFVANMAELAREGVRPERDIILALTADEELSNSPHNGVRWLLQNHRALIDAELAINEGGSGTLRNGKPARIAVQLAEKLYQSYQLEVTDRGGHSAAPRRDNPIYRLSRALARLADYEFPIRLNAVTRAYFERVRTTEEGEVAEAIGALLAGVTQEKALAPLADRPQLNAQIRTTCVATLFEAGHAENALPQTARATVNCRVLPDQSVSEVEKALARVFGDAQIKVKPLGQTVLSPPSPPNVEVLEAVTRLSEEMWPGVPVILTMSGGYTDNRWLRGAGIPAYGVSGLFTDPGKSGVHGLNEQVGVKELYDSKEFLYRLVKRLAGAK